MLTMAAMTLALAQQAGASGVEGEASNDAEGTASGSMSANVGRGRSSTILVRTSEGWRALEVTGAESALILPTTTRSEIVLRPEVGPDGIEFGVVPGAGGMAFPPEVQACVHPADQQLAQIDGEFVLLGPPSIPSLVEASSTDAFTLARLARRDGLVTSVAIDSFVRSDEPGTTLVGVGPTSRDPWPPRADSPWTILAGHLAASRPTESASNETLRFDQAFWCEVTAAPDFVACRRHTQLGAGAPAELEDRIVRAGVEDTQTIYGYYEAVAAPPGHVVTYVVSPPVAPSLRAKSGHDVTHARSDAGHSLAERRASDDLSAAVHFEGPDEQLDIRPTMGPGAAWGDVDLDGWNDLYLVQGGGREGSPEPTNRMYANVGSSEARGFDDVTDHWGGADTGAGMGALFFDADGDRDLDLFVANYGADVLFENRLEASDDGTPQLVDVSAAAGVGGDLWSAGVCAGDVDNDGDLDLYVTSYLEYDESQMPSLEDLPYQREDPVAMLPFAFPGQRNVLLINESTAEGLRFVDRAKQWRVVDEAGRGMQPVMFDFDRDGWLDLYVANDVSPNLLYKNNRDGRFRDVSFATGMDDPRGGMGVAIGDVDLDGDEDLFLTNWELEANALYTSNLLNHASQRHRVATFRDTIVNSGLGPHGIGVTSWGAVLFDLENDGDLDLYVANGYTSPDYESTGICVAQPDHLFTNDGRGRFTVAHDRIAPFAANGGRDLPSRCAIDNDFDRDGDVDLFVTANNSAYRLLENTAKSQGHWLGVQLFAPAPNTYAVGARVEVVTDRRTFVRTLLAGSGYLGGNAPELHFGLGSCERLERVVVHPPGRSSADDGPAAPLVFTPQNTPDLALDRWVTLDLTR